MRVYFRTEESKLDDGRPLYTLGVHREDGEVIAAISTLRPLTRYQKEAAVLAVSGATSIIGGRP